MIKFLKQDLGMTYKTLGILSPQHNLFKNKLLRQCAAKAYIDALYSGKRIINIDESVLRTTDHRRKGWALIRRSSFASHSQRLASLNIIAATCSSGGLYFTIN